MRIETEEDARYAKSLLKSAIIICGIVRVFIISALVFIGVSIGIYNPFGILLFGIAVIVFLSLINVIYYYYKTVDSICIGYEL